MNIRTKWLTVPAFNQTREMEVAQLWEVRWLSRNGNYAADTRPEVEAFTTREDAEHFADALRNAFALLRYSDRSVTTITVEQAA